MIRYRTEDAFGEGLTDPVSTIMTYETYTLGNTDIVEYLMEHYLQDNMELLKSGQDIADEIENGLEISEADIETFFKESLYEIQRKTGKNISHCLWLADKDVVKSYYMQGYSCNMDGYHVSDIILSDLGYDGTLYGYEEKPECVSSEWY